VPRIPAQIRRAAHLRRGLKRRARAFRAAREERTFTARMQHDPQAPELLLSPHLDDAVLDCWGVLAGGRELRIVNVFAGVPPPGWVAEWDAITGASDSAERARERLDEDRRALAHAGREAVNLDLLDAQYRGGSRPPTLAQIDAELIAHVPRASRVLVPAGIGGHADHLLVRSYGRTLLRAGLPVVLYAELPYCVLHGWPAWVGGAGSAGDAEAHWRSCLQGVAELPPLEQARVQRLDEQAAAAKLTAMRSYVTQLPHLSYGEDRRLEDPAIHGIEVSWELSRP
jgi:hypothetical protein